MSLFRLALALLCLAALCRVPPARAARAARVVSLNLCTDELLVLLAPSRITALSPLARDPALSVVAEAARRIPWARADAEAVLALHPDLVLAGQYGAQAVLAVLRRHGLKVVQVVEPASFAGIADEITGIAAALQTPAQGAAMIATMRARLDAVPKTPHGSAMLWEARGYTAGPGSFGDAVLRAASYRNSGTGRETGVEALLANPPNLLVTATAPAYPSLATNLLWHPALRFLPRRTIPPALLACPGPWSVAAVEALSRP